MKKSNLFLRICVLVFVISLVTSCKGQSGSNTENNTASSKVPKSAISQIGEYAVNVFEDSKGNLWFGTLSKGVAKYDGNKLTYDTTIGNRVSSIVEDSKGNLWFGTHSGVYKYDGESFINYTVNDGLCDNLVSNILIDKTGTIWVGTWGGVCRFNGSSFINFPLPNPDIEVPSYQETTNWLSEIMEDSKGNMWFGRDGYGATKYDGTTFTHFTKKDGLASNNVQDIQEDAQGNIWFGSRMTENDHPDPDKRQGTGGLNKYDGVNFISFPDMAGLNRNDVYQIYRDSKENLWISTLRNGFYKYNGEDFTNYSAVDSVTGTPKSVMSFLEDSKGTLWIGCAGGLFRLKSDGTTVNITTNGPWK